MRGLPTAPSLSEIGCVVCEAYLLALWNIGTGRRHLVLDRVLKLVLTRKWAV